MAEALSIVPLSSRLSGVPGTTALQFLLSEDVWVTQTPQPRIQTLQTPQTPPHEAWPFYLPGLSLKVCRRARTSSYVRKAM